MFDAKKLLDLLVQSGNSAAQGGMGNVVNQVGGMVGRALGQAGAGLGEAANRLDSATGASDRAGAMLREATGKSPADLLAGAKDFASKNQMMTGAALGGLAALLLGSGGGRAVIGSAARLGGLAMIGGLAYKAFQNYQAGKPLLDLAQDGANLPAAPALPGTDSNAHARRLVQAMIASASSDGVVDAEERAAILGNLKAAGLEAAAASFLENEFANPADIATLAAGITNPTEAAQVYAAARLAIDVNTDEERDFLAALAGALRLDAGLIAHIDAAAHSAKA